MADSLKSRKLAAAKKSIERRSAQRAARERAEARQAEDQRLENEKLKVENMNPDGAAAPKSRTDEVLEELNQLLKEENTRNRGRKMAEESAEELRRKRLEARERAAKRRKDIREAQERAALEAAQNAPEKVRDDMEILEVNTPEEKLRRIRMQETQVIPNLDAILEGVEDLTAESQEGMEASESAGAEGSPFQGRNSLYDSEQARLMRIRMQETRTLPSWDEIMGDMEDFDDDQQEPGETVAEDFSVQDDPEEAASEDFSAQEGPGAIAAENLSAQDGLEVVAAEDLSAQEGPEEVAAEDLSVLEGPGDILQEEAVEESAEIGIKAKSEADAAEEETPVADPIPAVMTEPEVKAEEAKAEPEKAAPASKDVEAASEVEDLFGAELAAAAAELDSVGGILASLDTMAVPDESAPQMEAENKEEAPKEREWKKKQRKGRRFFRVAGGILVVGLIGLYAAGANYFRTHFYPNTMMGNTDISLMSEEKLRSYFADKVDTYKLQIVQKDGTIDELNGSDIALKEEWDESIFENLTAQNGLLWPIKLIQGDDLADAVTISYDGSKFTKTVRALDCMSEAKQVMPEDAHLSNYTVESGYQVVPPMEGTAIDKARVTTEMENAVMTFADTIDLKEMDAYYTMDFVEDMDQLKKKAEVLNDHSHAVINYEIGDDRITLDANAYVEWFDIDADMNVTLNNDKVTAFVAELAEKYDTYGKPKTFKTSYDTIITVGENVEYGWQIDQEKEIEAIKSEIASGETVTRDLNYSHKAAFHTGNDYGNSYVEVSLENQELYLYLDGSLMLECKVVTGCTGKGNGTPPGIWGIRYKQQDRVLKGEDYETPVHFWMPFNAGIGLHDAYWRGAFGGEIYKTHGSHGCVNMPSKSAEAAYDMVFKGMPVIVY